MKRYPLLALALLSLLSACGKDKKTAETKISTRPGNAFSAVVPKPEERLEPLLRPEGSEDAQKPEDGKPAKPDCERAPESCRRDEAASASSSEDSQAPSADDAATPSEGDTVQAPEPPPEARPAPRPAMPSEDAGLIGAQEVAKDVSVNCKSGDCSPSVGMISMVTKDSFGWGAARCTGSLVGPDIVATNAHCIPQDISAPGSDCRGRIWLTFAADPSRPNYDKQVSCGKVLYSKISHEGVEGYDLAYFQLERPSNRPVLGLSRAGFADGETYDVHRVTPVRPGRQGELEKVRCKAIFGSRMFSAPLDGKDTGILFVDCPIVVGNSGSPILGADGAVRGVIFAVVDRVRYHSLFSTMVERGSQVPALNDLAFMSLGSNLACLPDPSNVDGGNLPEACRNLETNRKQAKAKYRGQFAASTLAQAESLVAAQRDGSSSLSAFGWAAALNWSDEQGAYAVGTPYCYQAGRVESLVGQSAEIQRPLFLVKAQYDKYLRETNASLVWGGWMQFGESIDLQKSGPGYRIQLNNSKSGQLEFVGLLKECKR